MKSDMIWLIQKFAYVAETYLTILLITSITPVSQMTSLIRFNQVKSSMIALWLMKSMEVIMPESLTQEITGPLLRIS